jgi:isoleucyl-tRNA synthetase
MTADKNAAYATLFHVLRTYLQVLAPFAPFLTEYLWKNLEQFEETPNEGTSIHLSLFPFASEKYLNKTLMEEIAMVRKIIKLSLFIRAKNKIAVKQPLKKLEVSLE